MNKTQSFTLRRSQIVAFSLAFCSILLVNFLQTFHIRPFDFVRTLMSSDKEVLTVKPQVLIQKTYANDSR